MFSFLNAMPEAYANLKGSPDYPDLEGTVSFFGVHGGTIVAADIKNIPDDDKFHGFHIHEGSSCTGTKEEPFQNVGKHYNPYNSMHPNHVGDLPPILSCDGVGFLVFYTNRFFPEDIIGRTIVLHEIADDFTTQPSGNSGPMIACGEIIAQE